MGYRFLGVKLLPGTHHLFLGIGWMFPGTPKLFLGTSWLLGTTQRFLVLWRGPEGRAKHRVVQRLALGSADISRLANLTLFFPLHPWYLR